MTLIPIGAEDGALTAIIEGLKTALKSESSKDRARALKEAIASLEAARSGWPPVAPLEARLGKEWQLHTGAIDDRSRGVLVAVLKAGYPGALMLCGAPVGTALAVLHGIFSEARVDGYVYEGERFNATAYDVSLKMAAAEKKVIIHVDQSMGELYYLNESLDCLQKARKEKVPVVLILEKEARKLPEELVAACLAIDLVPTQSAADVRKNHLKELCAGQVSERALAMLSRMTDKALLSLEVMIETIARTDPGQLGALIEMAAKAEGGLRSKGKGRASEVEWVERGQYHLDLVNADVPLDEILAVMRAGAGKKGARLLMSGVSGAGKTEYAKWLAREIGAPLMQRRANELLHWKFGMFEKLIHKAFAEASRDGAVLLIDEVESLIMNRRATRQWAGASALTNAFLTELDLFQGLFIGCTNYPKMLDGALMRRMTLKVEFHPLKPADRAIAYERALEKFGGPLDEAGEDRLSRLEGLCLGDIGNLERRLELLGEGRASRSTTAEELLTLLEKDVKQRIGGAAKRIGFA